MPFTVHTLSKRIYDVYYWHSTGGVGNISPDVGLQVLEGSWTVEINTSFQNIPHKNCRAPNQESHQ